MFDGSHFGQYIPGRSLLHRLDPRFKLLALIALIVGLIVARSVPGVLLLSAYVALLFLCSHLSLQVAWRSIRPVLLILAFAFFINLFIPPEGDPLLFSWFIFRISWGSLRNAFLMTLRVLALIFVSNLLLTLTTSAMEMSQAITGLLHPLRRFGVPVEDVGMMMSIALRFIPTLMDETDMIMKAQSSRGANYDTGGLMKRLRGFVTVLIPLFISAFRRAESLAEAMEARAYQSGRERSHLHSLQSQPRDYIFFLLTLLLVVLVCVYDRTWL